MNNPNRKEVAQQTLQTIEDGSYRNNMGEMISIKEQTYYAVANSKLYRADDFPQAFNLTKIENETHFEITDETTLEAAKRICRENENTNPFVLNFASAKNPGGGFLGGAQAQEESLARSSSLYPCLMSNYEMYAFNRKGNSCLYSDWMVYSPKVPVFRNDDGSFVEKPYLVSFITSPAANAGAIKKNEAQKVNLIGPTNRERARKLLWIANKENHQTLILGAWGCGVFQNDPHEIAEMFSNLLKDEFANCFERVVMAIYDATPTRKVYNAFTEVFA